ncbi:hypothetical protein MSPP1_000841 [Malassezia sp. CBS 17886]|nr:hypothetical protein MSPP1_000841 [Malassezia sp. CBS 17886]
MPAALFDAHGTGGDGLGTVMLTHAAPLASESNATSAAVGTSAFDALLSPSQGFQVPLTARENAHAGQRPDVWMRLQQQINHAQRRLAHIEGRSAPTDEELLENMLHRRSWVENVWTPQQRRALDADRPTATGEAKGGPPHGTAAKAPVHKRVEASARMAASSTLSRYIAKSTGIVNDLMHRRPSRVGNETLAARGNGYSQAEAHAQKQHSVTKAGDVSASHSLGLSIEANDIGYFATVEIGSSNKKYTMLVDSGSSDTWITGTQCGSCGSSQRQKLGKSNSKSLTTNNQQYKISYGTGSVHVLKGTDSMNIAGLQLNKFSFGLATQESSQFGASNIPFDGLMGLGGSSLSIMGDDTAIEALFKANQVSAPIVGYRLGRVADGTNRGQITFGAVDESQVSGSLSEFDNENKNGYWEIRIDDVKIGSQSVMGRSKKRGGNKHMATLDTGTSLIVAPKAQADAIHNAIPGASPDGQGGYTLPCTVNKHLSFTFSGKTYTVDARDLLFSPSNGNLQGTCVSAVTTGDTQGGSGWLLGAAFLKNVYFATNSKSNTVALGKLN